MAGAVATGVATALLCSCAKAAPEPDIIVVGRDSSPAARLAGIDVHSDRVLRAVVVQFEDALTTLEQKCAQTRTSSPSLGDIGIRGAELLDKAGRHITVLEVLRMLENGIHENADMRVDCTDLATLLLRPMGAMVPGT